ncbi:aldehyde dehydrogenase [Rhodoferax ferrireducens T118]|uniref:Aldehyde dehydrogenase n=1 Tax=Albidiferax ferrireducens (strain ATCC BAA-621 / DSM 15236 / T118) TaxID=338969 RepID=Q21QL6_ALBFT|nr:coniferyl aldehyde dehydrogenase [Rhodoferax ferrireducens]ABD67810.1 aldehyde dehydrogenase [Rhodoferax ferrireducens T118]WPC66963.1 coniferyl aldehyde dehydrogenase [Rhodoferax ferrireducens]
MNTNPLYRAAPPTDLNPLDNGLEATLKLQRAAYFAHPYPSFSERKADLLQLKALIRDNRDAIVAAISADYGNRSRHETLFAEIFSVMDGVDHTLKHLKQWMKPQRRGVDWKNFFGASNRVIPQPLGIVGAIVPWNFPINLSFSGLIATFAAGNRSMVKMSENSRHLAKLLIEKCPAYFPREKLAFFDETGGVGIEFSKLKFDHLLFTGSGLTGRAVMAAAAPNLCPVTLEMGGKSPAIICDDYPLRKAAERLLFVKCFNAGQICTTVDHAYIPTAKVNEFAAMAKEIVSMRYPTLDTPDYTSMIDERSFNRVVAALEEAQERGATLVQLIPGKQWDSASRKIAPHIVLNAPPDCALRTREIFGPVLPIIAYTSMEEPIQAINAGPRPLALYPFSNDKPLVEHLLRHVISGGVSVNDGLFHVGQHDLPFGGVGDSGMGHYHGHDGFVTFSKMRPVFYQAPFSAIKFLWPPYGKFATRYLDFLTR